MSDDLPKCMGTGMGGCSEGERVLAALVHRIMCLSWLPNTPMKMRQTTAWMYLSSLAMVSSKSRCLDGPDAGFLKVVGLVDLLDFAPVVSREEMGMPGIWHCCVSEVLLLVALGLPVLNRFGLKEGSASTSR